MSASIHDMAAANKNCSMVSIQISSFFVNTDSASSYRLGEIRSEEQHAHDKPVQPRLFV